MTNGVESSFHGCDALQFDGNRSWQSIDFHRGAARLVVLEVLGVQAIESVEVPIHVHEEHGHVDELFPAAAAGLEDGFHVGEHAMHLCFKIKRLEVAVVVQLQSWDAAVVRIASGRARPDAAQEQEVADASGVGVQPDGLGGVGGGNAIAHVAKVAPPSHWTDRAHRLRPARCTFGACGTKNSPPTSTPGTEKRSRSR